VSTFRLRTDMAAEVEEAFRARPHLVDGVPGFIRMDVIRSRDDPMEFSLLTYWVDEQSYVVWHHGHEYHEAHRGIPPGLKLVPGSAVVRRFDFVAD
jgi:heme-degrading monooxygenase HmoA